MVSVRVSDQKMVDAGWIIGEGLMIHLFLEAIALDQAAVHHYPGTPGIKMKISARYRSDSAEETQFSHS